MFDVNRKYNCYVRLPIDRQKAMLDLLCDKVGPQIYSTPSVKSGKDWRISVTNNKQFVVVETEDETILSWIMMYLPMK